MSSPIRNRGVSLLLVATLCQMSIAFQVPVPRSSTQSALKGAVLSFQQNQYNNNINHNENSASPIGRISTTALFAKKKKAANAKAAALEALEALEAAEANEVAADTSNGAAAVGVDLFDEPMSKKELMEMKKKEKKRQR